MCHRYGLPIGFVGIGGEFVGVKSYLNGGVIGAPLAEEELYRRIDEAKGGVDIAAFMGAPPIHIFGGGVPEETQNRDALWSTMIRSFQQVTDYTAHGQKLRI